MDKQTRVGYLMTIDEAMRFWQRSIEAEKAMGQPLTHEEKDKLLQSMQLGMEMTLEELVDYVKGKKTLVIKDAPKKGD